MLQEELFNHDCGKKGEWEPQKPSSNPWSSLIMIDCAVLVAVIGYLVYLFSTETVSTNCRTGEMDHKKPILVRAYNDIQDRWWPKPSEPEVKDEPLNQQQCYSRQEEQTTA